MSEPIYEQERIETLEAKNKQLRKVNEALMNRVEKSTDEAGSAYSLFESSQSVLHFPDQGEFLVSEGKGQTGRQPASGS